MGPCEEVTVSVGFGLFQIAVTRLTSDAQVLRDANRHAGMLGCTMAGHRVTARLQCRLPRETAYTVVTGHNPPRSESPVQSQGRIKLTESHIADLKAKFQDWRT